MGERVKVLADRTVSASETPALQITFDEAFTLHHRTVYRTAFAIVGDRATAEDISQEVFLKLYLNPKAFLQEDLLRAWLLRVTINTSRNVLRTHKRSAAREQEFAGRATDGEVSVSTSSNHERGLKAEEVRRALDKMREPMRSCLLLRHQGLSYKEIAAALTLKETSIGRYLALAQKEFLRVYGKIGGRK